VERITMKVAIPSQGDTGLKEGISEHFGRSPNYTIIDTKTDKIEILNNTSHHMGGVGYPPEILRDAGVEALICRGLGLRAIQMFKEEGIKVYVGASGTVGDALESWKAGELSEASEEGACQQHAFRGPLHGTGLCRKR